METLGNKFGAKNGEENDNKYICESCDYKCSKKYSWNRHILTSKHRNMIFGDEKGQIGDEKGQKGQFVTQLKYSCKFCQKCYESRNGLWKHTTKCKIAYNTELKYNESNADEPPDKELMMMILNDNSELKKMMLEQSTIMMKVLENGTNNNSNNTTNSHNKTFNLNFFLNETCKDAMNVTDFVESIKFQLSDLERVGELGYIEGISNIILKNLKDLDVTQRPVHCTDKKRETMYIKDEDKWEKDEEQKKTRMMIRKVTVKNARMLPKFKEVHPDCTISSSRFSDQYNNIIMEAMGGMGENDFEKEEKIIKKISKEIMVAKDFL